LITEIPKSNAHGEMTWHAARYAYICSSREFNILSKNWNNYSKLLNRTIIIFSKAVDLSLRPSISPTIEEFFSIFLNSISVLLEEREFKKAISLIEKIHSKYSERNSYKEKQTMYDYFYPDPVLDKLIETTYKGIYPNDFRTYRELIAEIPLLEFLVEQAKLFEFKDDNLNQTISYFFEIIYSNSSLSVTDRNDVFKKSISRLNNITSSLISTFSKDKNKINPKQINNFYIREWSSILRIAFLNDDIKTFQNVLNIKNDWVVGVSENQNICFKEIVLIIVMLIITDEAKSYEYKNKFLRAELTNEMSSGISTLISFLDKIKYEDGYDYSCLKNMWVAYNNMVFLTKIWKEITAGLTTFDHSPEIFYILYLIFYVDSDCYLNLFLEFPLQFGRIDRFDLISKDFEQHLSGTRANKIMGDFISIFSINDLDSQRKVYITNSKNISTKARGVCL
ncbi:MAG: hypothetical protein K8S23_00005, partial [Candidatus Cloacimonetes bacterium]|nr:hypothetical protein [Candidatus Cloacimonadota bacterium]